MKKVYRCFYPNHKIVVVPAILAKNGMPGQKGDYIQFEAGIYETENVIHQEKIESNSLFGVKIFLDSVEEEEQNEEPEGEPKRGRGNPNFGKKKVDES